MKHVQVRDLRRGDRIIEYDGPMSLTMTVTVDAKRVSAPGRNGCDPNNLPTRPDDLTVCEVCGETVAKDDLVPHPVTGRLLCAICADPTAGDR